MRSSVAVGDTSGVPYTRAAAAAISVGALSSSPTSTPARCTAESSAAMVRGGSSSPVSQTRTSAGSEAAPSGSSATSTPASSAVA